MVTPAAEREAFAHLQAALGMSKRRSCAVVGSDRNDRVKTQSLLHTRAPARQQQSIFQA
jgi:hypothetical protein